MDPRRKKFQSRDDDLAYGEKSYYQGNPSSNIQHQPSHVQQSLPHPTSSYQNYPSNPYTQGPNYQSSSSLPPPSSGYSSYRPSSQPPSIPIQTSSQYMKPSPLNPTNIENHLRQLGWGERVHPTDVNTHYNPNIHNPNAPYSYVIKKRTQDFRERDEYDPIENDTLPLPSSSSSHAIKREYDPYSHHESFPNESDSPRYGYEEPPYKRKFEYDPIRDRDRADWDRTDRDRADKDRGDRDRGDRDRGDREKNPASAPQYPNTVNLLAPMVNSKTRWPVFKRSFLYLSAYDLECLFPTLYIPPDLIKISVNWSEVLTKTFFKSYFGSSMLNTLYLEDDDYTGFNKNNLIDSIKDKTNSIIISKKSHKLSSTSNTFPDLSVNKVTLRQVNYFDEKPLSKQEEKELFEYQNQLEIITNQSGLESNSTESINIPTLSFFPQPIQYTVRILLTFKNEETYNNLLKTEKPECITANSENSYIFLKKMNNNFMVSASWVREYDGGDPNQDISCLKKTAMRAILANTLLEVNPEQLDKKLFKLCDLSYHRPYEKINNTVHPEQYENTSIFLFIIDHESVKINKKKKLFFNRMQGTHIGPCLNALPNQLNSLVTEEESHEKDENNIYICPMPFLEDDNPTDLSISPLDSFIPDNGAPILSSKIFEILMAGELINSFTCSLHATNIIDFILAKVPNLIKLADQSIIESTHKIFQKNFKGVELTPEEKKICISFHSSCYYFDRKKSYSLTRVALIKIFNLSNRNISRSNIQVILDAVCQKERFHYMTFFFENTLIR